MFSPRQRGGLGAGERLLLAVTLSSLAACSSGEPATGPILCQNDADCPAGQICRGGQCGEPGTLPDAGPRDAGPPPPATDGGALDAGGAGDGGGDDGGASDADGGLDGSAPGAFGSRCSSHGDCQSQICLQGATGSLCTRLCSGDCPSDYICKAFQVDRNRIVNLCVPFAEVYCVPCASANECPAEGDQCTDLEGATYCTRDCSAGQGCPAGYECRAVPLSQTAEGRASAADGGEPDAGAEPVFRQCVPVSGQCPGCVDRDGDEYGVGADCRGRDCNDTDPSVHPFATERCDGIDNNCDGRIDEGFDLSSDNANCGACAVVCDIGAGERCCDGACVRVSSSPEHCGRCGSPCAGGGYRCCDGICRDTESDPGHCGGCGEACLNPHGAVGCAEARCTPTCAPGFGDCDDDPRNGCETALTSVDHCGACGLACRNPHGGAACAGGACAPTCDPGWGNCDGNDANGCETDVFTTTAHCGRCGQGCTNAHGATACVDGQCRPQCEPGWGDCDGDPRNGCETDLATSREHCGTCNAPCVNENGTTACQSGICTPTCTPSFGDCDRNPRNGCETDLRTSLAHCGGCDRPCANPNGTTSCLGGVCVPSCNPNYADCDRNPNNGCETHLSSSTEHCGGCDLRCVNPHGATFCAQGACVPTCLPDWGDCNGNPRDGCETDLLSTTAHCGACNAPCLNANGTTRCVLGRCQPTCAPGFFDCNGNPRDGCESNLSQVTTCNACSSDSECPPDFYCKTGLCTKKKAIGAECTVGVPPESPGRECLSGNCVDGVCCDNDCSGLCRSCRLAGSRGFCTFIPSGDDPDGECVQEPRSTCGQDGTCDGAGGCRLWAAGTQCVSQSCSDGVQTQPRYCDGFGVCTESVPSSTLCVPFACFGTTSCYTTCTIDAHCAPGYTCVAGTCKVSGGQACNGPADCATRNCVDGVCCDTPCDGLCERCNLPGSIGTCTAIPAGADPDNECAAQPASSCGQTGACSGTRGSCQTYAAGTVCQPRSCTGGVQTGARLCDGRGTCQEPAEGPRSCAPYVCSSTTQSCFTSCASDAECVSGYTCFAGACKKPNGAPCAVDGECHSGYCTDGVCCNARCGGTCEKCNLAGRAGACDPIPAGQDPDNECSASSASSCGQTGECSGERTCALYPAGTVCAAAFCAGNTAHRPDTCDGNGICVDGGAVSCAPYACQSGTGQCGTSCAQNADCVAGFECVFGVCKKSRGQACGADSECASNFCVDGVCCEGRCSGPCEKCNQPGRAGFCDPVPAGTDPDDECPRDDPATCGRSGWCSGFRTCALHASGVVCGGASCTGNVSNLPDTCDGNGACVEGGTLACTPYMCNPATGRCLTSCTSSSDCEPGNECAGGLCKRSLGGSCSNDSQCASSYCTDGVCCEARCRGVCEKCNLADRVGFCDPVPAGTDPDEECPTDPVFSCDRSGVCSGYRSCQVYPAGTVCQAATCASTSSVRRAFVCNGQGACTDTGLQDCSPYACAGGACRTSCATAADCASGYGCRAATGQCLKLDGQVCASNGECLSGACCGGHCTNLATDSGNCGACGVACTNANGTTSCQAGVCVPVCAAGWGDCDGRAQNGCETDILATLQHCGGCGRACTNAHGSTACDDGACQPVCELGFGDCDGNARNGCETNLSTTVAHCGGCGLACTNGNGTTSCQAGQCAPICSAGFGDCDGNARNGCETSTQTSTAHCGGCGRACSNPNGSTACSNGVCAPTCLPGFGDCDGNPANGCETSTQTSTAHCGGCGLTCQNAHGTTTCSNGACIPTCEPGWGDCNGNPRDGCETDLQRTAAHCGGCGLACTNPNGTTACSGGTCVPSCAPGFFDCDGNRRNGCESNLAEVGTCNLCVQDAECPSGFYCQNGLCTRKKPLGDACTPGVAPQAPGRECQSGFCADGVCCENDCLGSCRSCRLTGSRGICAFVPSGLDPDNECPQTEPASCGLDGTCDGAGSCRLWGAGTECVSQSCSDGVQTNRRVCDGFGNCSPALPPTTLCAPYVCDGTTGCHTACGSSAECAAGYSCVNGECRVSGGQPCSQPGDCSTGHCVDGVCCNEPCTGLCERCNLADTVGTCTAIPAGLDPDNECDKHPVATCGQTGQCSGTRGVCERYPVGTVCQAQSCSGGVQTIARLCDGNGTCLTPAPATVSCSPYQCNSTTQSCFTSCATDAECATGHGCVGGVCKKLNGQPCVADVECRSGFCTDGFCCEARCQGVCERCNAPNRAGFCDPVPAGQDPEEECLSQDASTCGLTGLCSGSRSCALYPAGTVCAAAFCVGNTSNRADLCDGAGRCRDSGVQDCAPFTCNPATGLCRTACAAPGDCVTAYACVNGVCKRAQGQPCALDTECATGFCTDGVCCEARCNGVCEKCNLAGRVGFCDPVPPGADPDDECAADGPGTCGRTGSCSGARSCQLTAAGTVCAPGSCAGPFSANRPDTCNGLGVCVDNGVQDCSPFGCNTATGMCRTACATDADCAAGYACRRTTGQCLRADGQPCGADAECLSGACCAGVCHDLSSETSNCGACGLTCSNANGTTVCQNGVCTPTCTSGFGNCDGNPNNGCETSLATTLQHCGSCGQACTNDHGLTSCQNGVCQPVCEGGFGDCDGNRRNGCETDLAWSVAHCGGCGAACVNPNGTTACQGGDCVPSCAPGFGDCDGNPRNGCEQGLTSTTAHCGGCNQTCLNAHGSTACVNGSCAPTCEAGWGDCNGNPRDGCETNVTSSTAHCGGCNLPCVNANGTTLCEAGQCRPSCAPGFFDCNGNPRDGCETNLSLVTTCNACSQDAQCPAGFYCATGVCTRKKPLGEICVVGTAPEDPGRECQSGFCVDGVCCENDCTGQCRSCRLSGSRGFCTFVAAGQDADGECAQEAPSTCGQDGTCDGAGGCRLWAAGTQCLAQSCSDGVQTNARFCDGFHNCQQASPATTLCAPYVCNGTTTCYASCSSNAECAAGYTCASGVCKVSGGQPCNGPGDCATGHCYDGVCCNAACGGLCERCDLPGTIGTCSAVPAGTDPDNECEAHPVSTCGQTGACSGTRGRCELYAAGTVCQARTCVNGVQTNTRTCDGAGTCTTPSPASVSCTPYVCNATTQSCFNGCATDAECVSGFGCASGVCKKINGQSCTSDGECKSGFCTDNVCCESRCGGTCERCSTPGRLGICEAIPAGQDPDNECEAQPASTCGRTGECSGNRSCELHAAGTVCGAAFCSGNTSNLADTCSGNGACVDNGTRNCAPFTCDGTTGLCRTSCALGTDCITGYECVGGLCVRALGQPCSFDSECASGYCTDGVCCEGRCGGTCEKCNLPGRAGFCDPVPAGADPDDECVPDPVSTCGRSGFCSGVRSCALYAEGTVCAPAFCTGNASNLADTCNGVGACVDNGTRSCFPYVCDAATGLCRTSCNSGGDCQAGYECAGGLCKKSRGVSCGSDAECASGFCTDGVCCEARCGGTCEKCNQSGRLGYCDAVPAGSDPDDECAAEAPSTCGQTGACSGTRSCARYAAGTVCVPAFCVGNVSHPADTCDGSGSCLDAGTVDCFPYVCNPANGLCRSSCTVNADCQAGYQCAAGVCKKSQGQACGGDLECASGFCTDGVCCEGRCGGVCEKCSLAGRAGFCDPVPAGSDPDNECGVDPVSSCGKTGVCSGARSCQLYAAGTTCVAASCETSSVANRADTCNGFGTCVDNGTQDCAPYLCSGGFCRTSCASSADCVAGYSCRGGVCLKNDGQSCSTNAECFHDACCSGVCRNLSNDVDNCGACGVTCTNPHGSTTCSSGACSPTCDVGWGSCDGSAVNGCETSLRTNSDCSGCGLICDYPNANESCATGTCTLTSCFSGYSNCDGSQVNGCEVQHSSYPNSCGSPTDLGSMCGDTSCGFFCPGSGWRTLATRTGRTSFWFKARASECSDCPADIVARITLSVPPGSDYDLYVYRPCGTLVGVSNGTGSTEQVTVRQSERFGSDDSFDYWIEVRYFSGASCTAWTLTVEGRSC